MILGERWESLLDDSRIQDPRIGAELMEMHDGITRELLSHLGCWVDRLHEVEGWISVVLPKDAPGTSAPIWMPTYTSTLPFPRIEGSYDATEDERKAFDAGGNERLRLMREMVRMNDEVVMDLGRPSGDPH